MKTNTTHTIAAPRRLLMLLLPFLLLACQGGANMSPGGLGDDTTASTAIPQQADDVIIVDCLLPGQVRKLGGMTYLTPRKAARLSALECEVRGGEYVAYDRGNYQAALNVWREQAEAGDKEAQNYLGEIYMRGLGTTPKYDLAAFWFGKSADQGFDRAMINLGYLYENGLGVEKNPEKALSLYRKSTGLEREMVLKPLDVVEGERKELESLRREVERQREELETLRNQLSDADRRLKDARSDYEWRMRQVEAERRGLVKARQALLSLKTDDGNADPAQLTKMERELANREKLLNEQQAEADALKREVARLNAESRKYQAEMADLQARKIEADEERDQLRSEVEVRRVEAERLALELEKARTDLLDARDEYEWLEKRMASEREQLNRMKSDLDRAKKTSADRNSDAVRRLEAELKTREQELAKQAAEARRLKQQVARLDNSADAYRRQLAEYEDIRTREQKEMENLRRELAERREAQNLLERRLTRTQDELARIEREREWQVAQMEAEREGLQKAFAAFEAQKKAAGSDQSGELERLKQELEKRRDELSIQQARADQLQSQVGKLAEEAEDYKRQIQNYKTLAADAPPPTIRVIQPKLLTTRGSDKPVIPALEKATLEVVGKVMAPAGLFSLTVNDRPEAVDTGNLFKTEVPVEDTEEEITIVAVDRQGRRTAFSFVVRPQADKKRGGAALAVNAGQYYALLIGNNDYQRLPDLQTAVNDARSLGDVLERQYGFKTRVLMNASRQEIYLTLDEIRKKLTENDNLLIYYAGHGDLDDTNKRGYWQPVDADPDSHVNSIPNFTVTDILNAMSVRQAIIIADACYSGILTRSTLSREPSGMSEEKRLAWLQKLAATKSRTVLSSGGLQPVLDAGSGEHSIFAAILLDVLDKNNEILEANRLYRKIRDRVAKISRQSGLEQVPQYAANIHAGHESGDFLFIPVN